MLFVRVVEAHQGGLKLSQFLEIDKYQPNIFAPEGRTEELETPLES